jgi:hypothetical protein
MAKISGDTIEATDAYAALIYTITADSYTTTTRTVHGTRRRSNQSTTSRRQTSGKTIRTNHRNNHRDRYIVDNDNKRRTTNHSGNNDPSYEWPNIATIWQDTKTRPQAAPFEPFALAQWQVERLAKLTKLNYGKDNPVTLTHYSTPAKPMIYTTNTKHGHVTALLMPTKINNS